MELLEFERELREIAAALDAYFQSRFETRVGFCLLTFEFGIPAIANYISNVDRADMITSLEETAKRLKSGEFIPAAIPTKQ